MRDDADDGAEVGHHRWLGQRADPGVIVTAAAFRGGEHAVVVGRELGETDRASAGSVTAARFAVADVVSGTEQHARVCGRGGPQRDEHRDEERQHEAQA